ncbi:MAG: hypothetical protein AAGG44_09770 [Planctomycetota bacterium]
MEIFTANWLILFPVAFTLFLAMRLSCGRIDDLGFSWTFMTIRAITINLFMVGLFALGLRGHIFSLVWLLVLAVFGFIFFWKRRRLERSALFQMSLNAKTLAEQQYLARYVTEENSGWLRRRARALTRDLGIGKPWFNALESRGVAVGVYEKVTMRLKAFYGDRSRNTESPSLSVSPVQIEADSERLFGRLFLFSWTILIFPIIAFMGAFILPTLKAMFNEFEIGLPRVSRAMISLADFFNGSAFVFLVSSIPVLISIAFLIGSVVWLFPAILQLSMFQWLSGDYYKNAGFFALSEVLEWESDLVHACRRTAEVVPISYLSRAYLKAADNLESGESIEASFRSAKLLSQRELRLLADPTAMQLLSNDSAASQDSAAVARSTMPASEQIHDPIWSLRQLASYRIERMLLRYSTIVQIAVFILTMLFGVIVALIAIGLIAAMASLVTSLA